MYKSTKFHKVSLKGIFLTYFYLIINFFKLKFLFDEIIFIFFEYLRFNLLSKRRGMQWNFIKTNLNEANEIKRIFMTTDRSKTKMAAPYAIRRYALFFPWF